MREAVRLANITPRVADAGRCCGKLPEGSTGTDPGALRRALGRFATGVTVVTAPRALRPGPSA
jgi:hypothetical protein